VIEKEYYRKAIDWDHAMAQERANQSLGWRLAPVLAAYDSGEGADLRVHLADAAGAPILDASLKVDALFNARAADVSSPCSTR
jgi:hypothetical protein